MEATELVATPDEVLLIQPHRAEEMDNQLEEEVKEKGTKSNSLEEDQATTDNEESDEEQMKDVGVYMEDSMETYGRKTEGSAFSNGNGHSPLKQELQERLKKRISMREAKAAASSGGRHTKKRKIEEMSTIGSFSLIEPSMTRDTKISAISSLGGELEEELDQAAEVVEGFTIFAEPSPPKRSMMDGKLEIKEKYSPNKRRPLAIPTKGGGILPAFGPRVIKRAIKALGGRGTGPQLAEWIGDQYPEYLHYFGDKRKLRYSIMGILSAKAYNGVFYKEVIIKNGIKKPEWMLRDPDAPSDEEEDLKPKEPNGYEEEGISGLLFLSEASAPPSKPEVVDPIAKIEEFASAPPDLYSTKNCVICGSGGNDEALLLCDGCDGGYHMFCLDPPLQDIPTGAWYCEYCAPVEYEEEKDYETEEDESIEGEENPEEMEEAEILPDGTMVSARACEKHRRWKKRCPPECPMRAKVKQGTKVIKRAGRRGRPRKLWKLKRPVDIYEAPDPKDTRPRKRLRKDSDPNNPTYIDMIEEAIVELGGSATTPDITSFMEEKYGSLLATKAVTWRNSVSGCLSTHKNFTRISKEGSTRTYWTLKDTKKSTHIETRSSREKEEELSEVSSPPLSVPRLVARASPVDPPKRLFHPKHLARLQKVLETAVPTTPWQGIEFINSSHPLETEPTKLEHPGAIFNMVLSNDGGMLASISNQGTVRIWDAADLKLLTTLRDKDEREIEEFYCMCWSRDDKKIIVAGKLKDRHSISPDTGEHDVLPSPIKIFDVLTGRLVARLEGHEEEVLCLRSVHFDGKEYLLSGGQDSQIIRWQLTPKFDGIQEKIPFPPHKSEMILSFDFIPGFGNKFFVAACDRGLKLFDFETFQLLQTFSDFYGYLCDCVQIVDPKEMKSDPGVFFALTRGVELLDEKDEVEKPNSVHLLKIEFPSNGKGKCNLSLVHTFQHDSYVANVYLMKIASNGRYVLAPTTEGKVFVWNIRTAALVAILHDHENAEIRDILFHPQKKLLFSCGDDSVIQVYSQREGKVEVSSPEIVPRKRKVLPRAPSMYKKKPGPESPRLVPPSIESKVLPRKKFEDPGEEIQIDQKDEIEEEEEEAEEKDEETGLPSTSFYGRRRNLRISLSQVSQDLKEGDEKKKRKRPKRSRSEERIGKKPRGHSKHRGRGLPGACEKHKKEHMKCPAECEFRRTKQEEGEEGPVDIEEEYTDTLSEESHME